MIKLACNYSAELMCLIAEKRTDADYIKAGLYGSYTDLIGEMRNVRPVLLHGMGYYERTGMKNIGEVDFDRVNKYLTDCGSPHYGFHLAVTNSDLPYPMTDDEIHVLMSGRVQTFKKNINVPLLLENVPDTPEDRTVFDHRPYAEAEKINRLITENGVSFLLDITHAKITAEFRGWDVHEYLKALPLDLIREIHVNGSGRDETGNPTDPHAAMADEDYRLLEWTLQYSMPDIITLEYFGTPGETGDVISENLITQLRELKRIAAAS